jgi:hypothetical protein
MFPIGVAQKGGTSATEKEDNAHNFGAAHENSFTLELVDADGQRGAVSNFLFFLNSGWTDQSLIGQPRTWIAADAVSGVSSLGCPDPNPYSNSVVSEFDLVAAPFVRRIGPAGRDTLRRSIAGDLFRRRAK